MQHTIRSISITEDDRLVCDFLKDEIERNFEGVTVHSFYNGEDAVQFLTENPVDIGIFDITLPGRTGIECIRELKKVHPQMQMMVITVLESSEQVFEALKAGAVSYLLKTTPADKLIDAIVEVAAGGSPLSAPIARKVIAAFNDQQAKNNTHLACLSRREQEILTFLEKGHRYKEIADLLFISLETVRTHVRNIYEKLQVNSRIDALRKTGLI